MIEKNNKIKRNDKQDFITLIIKSLIQSQSGCGEDCACHKEKKNKLKRK